MSGMITKAGPKKFILQGRADPTAAYDAVGKDRAYGSETVGQILAWARENLDRDERQVLSERLLGHDESRRDKEKPFSEEQAKKKKKVLDFLQARLTPQELSAVAKILDEADAVNPSGIQPSVSPVGMSEDARIRWTSAGHYAAHHNALNMRAAEERERQDALERRWREQRMKAAAEEDFRKRYPNTPRILGHNDADRDKKKIASDSASFYARFPDAKLIGHV
jgi:hypothetical protein